MHKYHFFRLAILVSFAFLFSLSPSELFAQKLKYKKIFKKLQDGEYDVALEDLQRFLELNPDHANANLQMAMLAENYLKDCEKAVNYYSKALKLIDEVELEQNEKYYDEFKRRDFRSGDYVVRQSDIKEDLESRIENCDKS